MYNSRRSLRERKDWLQVMMLGVQYGEDVDVEDWFSAFCMVHCPSAVAEPQLKATEEAAPPNPAKKPRNRASSKVLQVCPHHSRPSLFLTRKISVDRNKDDFTL